MLALRGGHWTHTSGPLGREPGGPQWEGQSSVLQSWETREGPELWLVKLLPEVGCSGMLSLEGRQGLRGAS